MTQTEVKAEPLDERCVHYSECEELRGALTALTEERKREKAPFVVDTCCGGRDVWHFDESKHRHAGPMKKIGNQRHPTGPNTYMNFYECVACHERAWVGLDADSRIVTRREGEL